MKIQGIDPQEEIRFCIKAMRDNDLPINLNSLLFGIVYDGESGGWTYFDELAHDTTNKWQGDELTDDEIMTTIKLFVEYTKKNNIK